MIGPASHQRTRSPSITNAVSLVALAVIVLVIAAACSSMAGCLH